MMRVIYGDTGSGKTANAMKRYNQMLLDNIDSNEILVLVANRTEKSRWEKEVGVSVSSQLKIFSYFGFVQRELKLFWPLVLKKCSLIKKVGLEPVFMPYEASQSLMYKTVEYYRKKGNLKEVISDDEGIGKKLLSNLTGASLSNTSYRKIGEKICYSKPEDERLSVDFYKEMNEITAKYLERILEEGILDSAAAIYLYSNYLLKDERYREYIKGIIKYLIVDNLELAPISQVDFIDEIYSQMKGVFLYCNSDGSHGIYQFSRNYLEMELLPKFQREELPPNLHSQKFRGFLEVFSNNLLADSDLKAPATDIHCDLENEYRSIENRKVFHLVKELLESGVSGEEIGVVAPRYDVTLDFGLSRIAKKSGIPYRYTSKNEKIIDDPYVFALIVFANLFYRFKEIRLNYDEVKVFFNIILQMDLINSALLAQELSKKEYRLQPLSNPKILKRLPKEKVYEYNRLVDFLQKVDKNISIDRFFTKVYLEFFMERKEGARDIRACKELIDSSENFLQVMGNFPVIKDSSYEFVKFVREGAKTTPTLDDIGNALEGDYLSLSTPGSFIGTGQRVKYLILCDVRNPLYTLKSNNEFQNLWSLNKDWPLKREFTAEDGLQAEKLELDSVVKRMIRSTVQEIYIYGTVYSYRSIEQQSLFYRGLLRTLML